MKRYIHRLILYNYNIYFYDIYDGLLRYIVKVSDQDGGEDAEEEEEAISWFLDGAATSTNGAADTDPDAVEGEGDEPAVNYNDASYSADRSNGAGCEVIDTQPLVLEILNLFQRQCDAVETTPPSTTEPDTTPNTLGHNYDLPAIATDTDGNVVTDPPATKRRRVVQFGLDDDLDFNVTEYSQGRHTGQSTNNSSSSVTINSSSGNGRVGSRGQVSSSNYSSYIDMTGDDPTDGQNYDPNDIESYDESSSSLYTTKLTKEEEESILRYKQVNELKVWFNNLLTMDWVYEIELRSRAKVPIISMTHRNRITCDISLGIQSKDTTDIVMLFKNNSGIYFTPLSTFLKVFLSLYDLDQPFTGGLGSFKLYGMVAYILQNNTNTTTTSSTSSTTTSSSSSSSNRMSARTTPITSLGSALKTFLQYYGDAKRLNLNTSITINNTTFSFAQTRLVKQCQQLFQRTYSILTTKLPVKSSLSAGNSGMVSSNTSQDTTNNKSNSIAKHRISNSTIGQILNAELLQHRRDDSIKYCRLSPPQKEEDKLEIAQVRVRIMTTFIYMYSICICMYISIYIILCTIYILVYYLQYTIHYTILTNSTQYVIYIENPE